MEDDDALRKVPGGIGDGMLNLVHSGIKPIIAVFSK